MSEATQYLSICLLVVLGLYLYNLSDKYLWVSLACDSAFAGELDRVSECMALYIGTEINGDLMPDVAEMGDGWQLVITLSLASSAKHCLCISEAFGSLLILKILEILFRH